MQRPWGASVAAWLEEQQEASVPGGECVRERTWERRAERAGARPRHRALASVKASLRYQLAPGGSSVPGTEGAQGAGASSHRGLCAQGCWGNWHHWQ